jgi:hypothetical protein
MKLHANEKRLYKCPVLLLLAALAFCPFSVAQDRINRAGGGNLQIDGQAVKKQGLQRPAGKLRLKSNSRDTQREAHEKKIMEKEAHKDREQLERTEQEAKNSNRESKELSRDALDVIKDSRELKKEAIRSIHGE